MWTPSRDIIIPRRWNGTDSIISFSPNDSQELGAQSALCRVILSGGGPVASPIIFSHCDSGGSNGIIFRFAYTTNASTIRLQCDSTGTAGAPLRVSGGGTPSFLDNTCYDVALTWDGGLTASNIHLYFATIGNDLVEVSGYGTTTNGTTAIKGPAGQQFTLGNRPAAARPFQGDKFIDVRWDRILALGEFEAARKNILAVPNGLRFAYANGKDWGPFGLLASSSVNVPLASTDPKESSVAYLRPLLRSEVAAAATFNAAWASAANVMIQSGAITT